MIPIYKLDKLPRTQKLRKIAKYFSMAEQRLIESSTANDNRNNVIKNNYDDRKISINVFTFSELEFFKDAAKLLAKDDQFTEDARKVFVEAVIVFEKVILTNNNIANCSLLITNCIRSLNNIKHILFTETGHEIADWDFTTNTGSLDSNKRKVFNGMQVYLEDIRSPFNVGAMFRTAESFGVEKIILSPFCADPRHRRAERTAMGCIDIVPWERQELFAPFAAENKNELSLSVFALETGGVPINEFKFPERGIMITGSEELGVSPRALEAADASLGRVSIPIYGAKASLNVSTAFGIALNAWAGRISAQRHKDTKEI